MGFRRLPVLVVGPVAAGLLVLGGCAGAPAPAPQAAPAPVAATTPAPSDNGAAPCTARLRPGSGGAAPMSITPEAREAIERLHALPPGDAGAPTDPALAARLAEVRDRVERAAQPCADR
ncbi:hypothetical protein ACQPX6_02890 [Actinomycetospora sp. CA-101289]|uniref:hypothetical protein n=1 Tax=Actinomycetospora sp. CA-101289 TaxID=3239893 RepID=UPI003D994ACE